MIQATFSPKYIAAWIKICEQFPTIRFWFPTREWKRDSQLPHLQKLASLKNACIKPSAIYVDEPAPQVDGLDGGTSVYTSKAKAEQDGHLFAPQLMSRAKMAKFLRLVNPAIATSVLSKDARKELLPSSSIR